jgi:hypothetical protein
MKMKPKFMVEFPDSTRILARYCKSAVRFRLTGRRYAKIGPRGSESRTEIGWLIPTAMAKG